MENLSKQLTKQQQKNFRQSLEALRAELREMLAISSKNAETVELDQTKIGRLSRIDAMQQQQMAIANRTAYLQRLAQVDVALSDLATGDYGYCHDCGEQINPKRLEIQPESPLCVNCQSAAE